MAPEPAPATAAEIPVVVCVAADPRWRTRLATVLDGPAARVGELEVDRDRCRARWRDTSLRLTPLERDLLAGLAAEPAPRVWTYQELYAAAWRGRYLDPRPVRAAVQRLRRKLRRAGFPVRVDAVQGVGFELVAETDPGADPAPG